MQAKLPDINAAIVVYRNSMINAYDRGDFTKAVISLDAINALLPEDYKLEVNTEKYNELVKGQVIIICDKCKEEFQRGDIRTYEKWFEDTYFFFHNIEKKMEHSYFLNTITHWCCTKCKHERPLLGSNIIDKKLQVPYYIGVVPLPPKWEWHRRREIEREREIWFDIVVQEIEQKIGLYRTEYASQQEAIMETMPNE